MHSDMRCALLSAFLILLTATGSPGVAQTPGPSSEVPPTIVIQLSNFAFEPASLTLVTGRPVRLRFVNDSGGGHDYAAPGFFAMARYPAGAAAPAEGRIELEGGTSRDIDLTPGPPGNYPVECTHFLHHFFGMHGNIIVTG